MDARWKSDSLDNAAFEQLIGRREVVGDRERLRSAVDGKTILITGAAGSIGSELCRQISSFSPRQLILFDQAESELFRIDRELRQLYPALATAAVLGDVRDVGSVGEVFGQYAIDSIHHTAAYKHLPMMESHVVEAVRNNVLGTWNLLSMGMRHNVQNFVLVSSDKAVNPTSVMGATKRVAECLFRAARSSGARFASVRCGNVVGSIGSVVPVFEQQIAAGGPVTVTDPRACRYFMSVREAAQSLIGAAAAGAEGHLFVPDMGSPVRILDLAHTMIRLAGLVPDHDIAIRFTGLLQGEKIEEELTFETEHPRRCSLEGLDVCQSPDFDVAGIETEVEDLRFLIEQRDSEGIVRWLVRLVPEYRPQSLRSGVGVDLTAPYS